MRPTVLAAALSVTAGLAACGGASTRHTTTHALAAPGADPCALVTPADLTAIAQAAKPTRTRTAVTCTYTAGTTTVLLRVTAASAATTALLRASAGKPAHGARAITTQGAIGNAAIVPTIGGGASSQAQALFVKGRTLVSITLTEPGAPAATLVARASALGRGAAGRL